MPPAVANMPLPRQPQASSPKHPTEELPNAEHPACRQGTFCCLRLPSDQDSGKESQQSALYSCLPLKAIAILLTRHALFCICSQGHPGQHVAPA